MPNIKYKNMMQLMQEVILIYKSNLGAAGRKNWWTNV